MPTLTLCTDAFDVVASSVSQGAGMPDVEILFTQHPIAPLTPAEVDVRVEALMPTVRRFFSLPNQP